MPRLRLAARLVCRRSLPVAPAVMDDVGRGHDGERHDEAEHRLLQADVVGGPRQEHRADREVLEERLVLAERSGRQRDPAPAREHAVARHEQLARRDHDHRPPRDVAALREHREAAEHEHLVGDRVEERTRAGRAVAPREEPVEAVGRGDHEPERTAVHDAPCRDMSTRVGTPTSMRPSVRKFAGVASAV